MRPTSRPTLCSERKNQNRALRKGWGTLTVVRERKTNAKRWATRLDYFGARYYSNGLGRFITPDWSVTPVPVPYADLDDPQSLCQYCYVRGLPTTRYDPYGH